MIATVALTTRTATPDRCGHGSAASSDVVTASSAATPDASLEGPLELLVWRSNDFTSIHSHDPVTSEVRAANADLSQGGSPIEQRLTAVGAPLAASVCCVATKGDNGVVQEAFHHTDAKVVDPMLKNGLWKDTYATPTGGLSPLQAQVELALSPEKAMPNAVLRIDVAGMRADGYEIPEVTRVSNVVTGASGRVYTVPGGGFQKVGGYWTSDGRLVTYWD